MRLEIFDNNNTRYIRLCEEPWFRELVKKRFLEIQPLIDDMMAEGRRLQHSAPKAFNRNFDRWKIMGVRANLEPEVILSVLTYDGNVDWLMEWFENRRQWLLDYFETH